MSAKLYRLLSLTELGLKEFYSSEGFDKCVRRLELTEGLFWCAAVNHISANCIHSDFDKSQLLISKVLNVDIRVRARAQSLLSKYTGLIILGRSQLLHLMIAIARKSQDTPKGRAKSVRQNDFLQAAINADFIANQEWFHEAITQNPKLSKMENVRKRLPAIRVMCQFGIMPRNPFQQSLGRLKAILLDEMFSKDSELSQLYYNATGMTIEDFIYAGTAVLIVGVKSNILKHPKSIPADYFNFNGASLWKENPHNQDIIEKFLNAFSVTPAQLKQFLEKQENQSASDYTNFKLLRERPLIKSHLDSYVVADADFLIRAIEVGPLFQIINGRKRSAQSVFGSFGTAFEKYCQRIISEYNTGLEEYNAEGYLGKNIETTNSRNKELDISLTYGESLVLIECKAVWLKDEFLSKAKYEKFWDHVMEKVGVSIDPTTQEENRPGLGQLADLVEIISDKNSRFSDPRVRPSDLKKIFPVLLVHDSLFNAPDFGFCLAREFAHLLGQSELSLTGYFDYNGITIANLILLTADELEWFISTSSTESLLKNLEKYTSIAPTRSEKNFSDYINENLGPVINSKNPLTKPASELFDAVIERFLPQSGKNIARNT